MYEIGRLAVKIAGRDSGKTCVIIEVLNNNFVLIDGQTRRRKCNILHLEPLNQIIEIKNKASHDEVKEAFKKINLEVKDSKPKKTQKRPVKGTKSKSKPRTDKKKSLFGKKKGKTSKKEETPLEKIAETSKEEKPKKKRVSKKKPAKKE